MGRNRSRSAMPRLPPGASPQCRPVARARAPPAGATPCPPPGGFAAWLDGRPAPCPRSRRAARVGPVSYARGVAVELRVLRSRTWNVVGATTLLGFAALCAALGVLADPRAADDDTG